mgnify:CR=1 FL=1
MLAQFQSLYPTGSLTSELVQIDRGKYIVRSSVQVEGVIRATGMAADETIEEAEDKSRARALMVLGIAGTQQAEVPQTEVKVSPQANLEVLPNRSLTTPATVVKEHQGTTTKAAEVTQTPPLQTAIPEPSHPPEIFSTQDNSDIYDQNFDRSLIPTYSEPEFDAPIENPDIASDYPPETFDKPLPIPTYNEPEFDTPIENPDITSDYQPETEEEPSATKVTPQNKSSTGKSTKKTTKTSTTRRKKKAEPIDLSEVIAKTDVEMERLGWTPQQGREYLINTYGKRGRTLLTEQELLDFLNHLESLPAPDLLETDPLAGF